MRPEAGRLMPDAVHVEGVKANLSGHVLSMHADATARINSMDAVRASRR
jgi:hypothetical protein